MPTSSSGLNPLNDGPVVSDREFRLLQQLQETQAELLLVKAKCEELKAQVAELSDRLDFEGVRVR